MKRSQRMQTVRKLKLQAEQQEVKKLGTRLQELRTAEQQLAELKQYRQDYYQGLSQPANIAQANQLAAYQTFLTRLNSALERQSQMVHLRKQAVDQQRKNWLAAKARLTAIDNLIVRFQQEERLGQDRQEQKILDDLVSRSHTQKNSP